MCVLLDMQLYIARELRSILVGKLGLLHILNVLLEIIMLKV